MKITIQEDAPGELDAMTHTELAARIYKGFVDAADALFKGKSARDGEVHAIEEIRASLEEGFKKRLDALRRDLEKGMSDEHKHERD